MQGQHYSKTLFAFGKIFLLSENVLRELSLKSFLSYKIEAFNSFIKWISFGGEGMIRENDTEEQDKIMKFKPLLADARIFQISMPRSTMA